jgi:hypothetical protein
MEHQGSQPGLFPPEKIAEIAIQARNRQPDEPLLVDLKKLLEQQCMIVGIHEVCGRKYEEFGFDKVLSNPKRTPVAVLISILKHQHSKTLYGVPSPVKQDFKKIYQI